MLSLSGAVKIYCSPKPVNLHRSFDGLPGLVRQALGRDPLDGSLYVFFNRTLKMVKILCWEGDGYSLWSKRLERGQFNLTSRFAAKSSRRSAGLHRREGDRLLRQPGGGAAPLPGEPEAEHRPQPLRERRPPLLPDIFMGRDS